jgi:hypothetical protein
MVIHATEVVTSVVLNLGYAKTCHINQNKHRNHLNLEPALILALTKIRQRI